MLDTHFTGKVTEQKVQRVIQDFSKNLSKRRQPTVHVSERVFLLKFYLIDEEHKI